MDLFYVSEYTITMRLNAPLNQSGQGRGVALNITVYIHFIKFT